MDDNRTPEIVTEDEAIEKVKAWIVQMNWEKAQEGCKEILEIDPSNAAVAALLAQAEKGIAERPGASETSSMERAIASEAVKEAIPSTEKPIATPSSQPQAQTPAPAAPPVAQPAAPAVAPAPTPVRKSKSTVMIAAIVGFLVVVLLILALVFGWLNPVFDWIFGLIG